jgi:hypothetical protein
VISSRDEPDAGENITRAANMVTSWKDLRAFFKGVTLMDYLIYSQVSSSWVPQWA